MRSPNRDRPSQYQVDTDANKHFFHLRRCPQLDPTVPPLPLDPIITQTTGHPHPTILLAQLSPPNRGPGQSPCVDTVNPTSEASLVHSPYALYDDIGFTE